MKELMLKLREKMEGSRETDIKIDSQQPQKQPPMSDPGQNEGNERIDDSMIFYQIA